MNAPYAHDPRQARPLAMSGVLSHRSRRSPSGFLLAREKQWTPVRLQDLLARAQLPTPRGLGDRLVRRLASRPSEVAPGALVDLGEAFSGDEDLARQGAVAVVIERGRVVRPVGLPVIEVEDLRAARARLACAFHDDPSLGMLRCAVAGAAGKSSVAQAMRAALQASGKATGIVGSLGHETGGACYPALDDCPDVERLQGLLREMRDHGREAVVVETGVEALERGHLDGFSVDVGVITPRVMPGQAAGLEGLWVHLLSRLPYGMQEGSTLVVPAGHPVSDLLAACTDAHTVTYGFGEGAEVRGTILRLDRSGGEIEIAVPFERPCRVSTSWRGRHQLENLLAAAAGAYCAGGDLEQICAALEVLPPVRGRCEPVSVPRARCEVWLDAADRPERIHATLSDARALCEGRVWALMAPGVHLEPEAQAACAAAAGRLADVVVITGHDSLLDVGGPATTAMLRGLPDCRRARLEGDRGEAVRLVLEEADEGDLFIVFSPDQGRGRPDRHPRDDRLYLPDPEDAAA